MTVDSVTDKVKEKDIFKMLAESDVAERVIIFGDSEDCYIGFCKDKESKKPDMYISYLELFEMLTRYFDDMYRT